MAALDFCIDNLRVGGNFVCKFFQGPEDKALETKLKRLFEKVHREKPEASRQVGQKSSFSHPDRNADYPKESREGYFVALRRKDGLSKQAIIAE